MQDMIATPGHAHASMEQELTLNHDLLGGTMTMRRAGAKWLPREEAESWSAWQGRLQRSVLFNGLGRLIQVLSGKPFEKEVKLQNAHPHIEALAQNMDGCHRALPEFTRLLLHALLADAARHSWKDEAWTICFIVIFFMCFMPQLQHHVAKGFAILQTTPDWFQ